jgi:hypothetical protein
MRYFIFAVLFCFITQAQAEPRAKPVELHKRTTLVAEILPDLGVRFTFPFVLDEQDAYVPFTLNITNPSFELQKREAGRNYFVITVKQNSPINMLGEVFITVAGFEITIELKTTNNLSKFYSDIVFKLNKDDREDLIQKAIAQRTKSLESEYKKKFADIENISDQKAVARVGRLALTTPTHQGIKEEAKLKLSNGDRVSLFVDEVVDYDPYSIFVFNLIDDSNTQGISILDAKIFSVDKDTKQERPLDIGKDLPPRVQPNEKIQAAITILNKNLNPKEYLKLQVLTDKGILEAQW